MGMFDYVKFKAPCKKCSEIIENEVNGITPLWQTKDSDCTLSILDPENLDIQTFYTSCPNCKTWNEYKKQARFIIVKNPHYE